MCIDRVCVLYAMFLSDACVEVTVTSCMCVVCDDFVLCVCENHRDFVYVCCMRLLCLMRVLESSEYTDDKVSVGFVCVFVCDDECVFMYG